MLHQKKDLDPEFVNLVDQPNDVERWPGKILEGHDLTDYSTRQANLEVAC